VYRIPVLLAYTHLDLLQSCLSTTHRVTLKSATFHSGPYFCSPFPVSPFWTTLSLIYGLLCLFVMFTIFLFHFNLQLIFSCKKEGKTFRDRLRKWDFSIFSLLLVNVYWVVWNLQLSELFIWFWHLTFSLPFSHFFYVHKPLPLKCMCDIIYLFSLSCFESFTSAPNFLSSIENVQAVRNIFKLHSRQNLIFFLTPLWR